MNKIIIVVLILCSMNLIYAQDNTPAEYWDSLIDSEKLAFVNGAYTAISRMKLIHMEEVKMQYGHDPYWREPYFVERYYEILDQHISDGVGYNIRIPLIAALRIVSTAQDGDRQKADVLLLKAQRQYRPED